MNRNLIAVVLSVATAFAQAMPSFEVASVKLAKGASRMPIPPLPSGEPAPLPPPPAPPGIQVLPNGLTMRGINMNSLLLWAYNIGHFQLSAPRALGDHVFDVTAKAAKPVPPAELRLMLQSLLAERFHLKTHKEKQDRQVSALVVAKGGIKFHASAPGTVSDHQFTKLPDGRYRDDWRNLPMSGLVGQIGFGTMSVVVDMTGLQGSYDISFVRPAIHQGSPAEFYDAWRVEIQNQLGLTYAQRRAPVEMLVVDHVDETPSAN